MTSGGSRLGVQLTGYVWGRARDTAERFRFALLFVMFIKVVGALEKEIGVKVVLEAGHGSSQS